MDQETTAAFLEYEETKRKISRLEERLDELKPKILPHIKIGQVVDAHYGAFVLKVRTSWEYTEEVKTLVEKIDKKKAEEEAKGEAKKIEKTYLEYRAAKK